MKACKKSREDRLSGIARTFELEIIYAFGSHAEDALKWMKGFKPGPKRSHAKIGSGIVKRVKGMNNPSDERLKKLVRHRQIDYWINSEEHFQRINLCSNNFTM